MGVWFRGEFNSFSQNKINRSKKSVCYGDYFVILKGMQLLIIKLKTL
jgi:hypothetical protein